MFFVIIGSILEYVSLSGQHMNLSQCRGFVAFCFYWKYFRICGIVRTIDNDATIGLLYSSSHYPKYFGICANKLSLPFLVTVGSVL